MIKHIHKLPALHKVTQSTIIHIDSTITQFLVYRQQNFKYTIVQNAFWKSIRNISKNLHIKPSYIHSSKMDFDSRLRFLLEKLIIDCCAVTPQKPDQIRYNQLNWSAARKHFSKFFIAHVIQKTNLRKNRCRVILLSCEHVSCHVCVCVCVLFESLCSDIYANKLQAMVIRCEPCPVNS